MKKGDAGGGMGMGNDSLRRRAVPLDSLREHGGGTETSEQGRQENLKASSACYNAALAQDVASRVMELYSSEASQATFESVLESYAEDAVFEDPVVKVQGKKNVHQQFWAVRNFVISQVIESRIFEECSNRNSGSCEVRGFAIEALIQYRICRCQPQALAFTLKQTTIVEISETAHGSKVIRRHQDFWSIPQSFERAPVIGFCYSLAKVTFGTVSSSMFTLVRRMSSCRNVAF